MELAIQKKYYEQGGTFEFSGVIQVSILMKNENLRHGEVEKEHRIQFEVPIVVNIEGGSINDINIPYNLARERYFMEKDDVLSVLLQKGISVPIGVELIAFNNHPVNNPEMDIFLMESA